MAQYELEKLKDFLVDLKEAQETGTKIITWYTKESFLYRMINNTIRSQSLTDIFLIRYIIYMLDAQLRNCKNEEYYYTKKLYRGTCI